MNFSVSSLIGGLLFGVIGVAAWRYGKAALQWRPMVLGVALVVFPYFVDNVWWLYTVGFALTAALFVFRE